MASAEQVKALIVSHAEGDDAKFYSVALQVAARAARGGHNHFAQELKELVDRKRVDRQPHGSPGRPTPVAQPRGELAGLLSASYPAAQLSDLVVEPTVREALERAIVEQRQADRLHAHGFGPLRRLLLLGPPGTGKTMSAGVIAAELHKPLFTIRLDGLITKFMGETASKLRLVFDALAQTPGVYLFDEVDALGGERSRANDVGEIRRVLNSFLQFLENDRSDSILVAATNHPQLLDQAMFRRFDAVIEYPLPTPTIARDVIRNRLAHMRLGRLAWAHIDNVTRGLSHGEITLAAEQAAKDTILAGDGEVTTARVVAALRERRSQLSN